MRTDTSFTVAQGDFVEVNAGEVDQGGRKHSWIIQVLELFEDVQVSPTVAVHLACKPGWQLQCCAELHLLQGTLPPCQVSGWGAVLSCRFRRA